MKFVFTAAEGALDRHVVVAIVGYVGLVTKNTLVSGGKHRLDRKLGRLNRGVEQAPWFVLRDLDSDEPCAGALVRRLLPDRREGMIFRVAVRETESWLLADRDGIARFIGVSTAIVPRDVEYLTDPKQKMIALAKRSRKRSVRESMVPPPNSGAKVGQLYVDALAEFVQSHWDIDKAAGNSLSLSKCLARLREVEAALA